MEKNSVQELGYVLVLADPVMANILQLWFMDAGGNILQYLNKKTVCRGRFATVDVINVQLSS